MVFPHKPESCCFNKFIDECTSISFSWKVRSALASVGGVSDGIAGLTMTARSSISNMGATLPGILTNVAKASSKAALSFCKMENHERALSHRLIFKFMEEEELAMSLTRAVSPSSLAP